MADPLSLVASIVAVVGVGGQVAKAVKKLASLKGAPDIILALNNEITDLHLVVLAIEDVFQKHCSSGVPFPGNRAGDIHVDAAVTKALQFAKDKTVELETLYQQIAPALSTPGGTSKVNKTMQSRIPKLVKNVWIQEQRRVKQIQQDLHSARLKLTAALGILNS